MRESKRESVACLRWRRMHACISSLKGPTLPCWAEEHMTFAGLQSEVHMDGSASAYERSLRLSISSRRRQWRLLVLIQAPMLVFQLLAHSRPPIAHHLSRMRDVEMQFPSRLQRRQRICTHCTCHVAVERAISHNRSSTKRTFSPKAKALTTAGAHGFDLRRSGRTRQRVMARQPAALR